MFGRILAFAVALAFALPASAQDADPDAEARALWAETCSEWDEWDKPAPPFRIHGDTYYVGTCGIGAIFVAGGGHVLIDTGTEAGAEVVLANIAALGFDAADIGMILASHEHHDHVGGLARVMEVTGPELIANREVWQVYATGLPDPRDPQFTIAEHMTPVEVSSTVIGGMRVGLALHNRWFTPIATPGHTPGALSWQWQSCEGVRCVSIVYADSLSAVSADDYRFSDHPEYVQAYREGIVRLAALDCDILITPHPSASGLRDRLIANDMTAGMDCAAYAADRLERLEARLAREAQQ